MTRKHGDYVSRTGCQIVLPGNIGYTQDYRALSYVVHKIEPTEDAQNV